ncbi:hypothetical protein [Marinobacterium lutimaris]|uniref:Uncharacterized protein n=1 Tax=Marinobacterium lutimaris TaxID=568106 RepID=A0A1H5XXW3_9GAMM|nr:hypothetical protein [Marinobacterium lutimaris]SEG16375.1 hypothetical protein SAMN05444390_1011538 [Marinobacterium lutimaris]
MSNFPALINGDNRPLLWSYALNQVEGEKLPTNSVTILMEPNTDYDESGEYPGRPLSSVTLTRAELREMLKALDEDIERLRRNCPDIEFE